MFNIVIKRNDNSEESLFFRKSLVKIGRHSTNDIVIQDEMASRFHAEIEYYNDKFFVRDLVSKNGVFVNEAQILEQSLDDGSIIRIGATKMVFKQAQIEDSTKEQKARITTDVDRKFADSVINEHKVEMTAKKDHIDNNGKFLHGENLNMFLQSSYDLSRIILKAASAGALLAETITLIGKTIRYKKAVFFMYDATEKKLEPVVIKRSGSHPNQTDHGIEVSKTIVETSLKDKAAIFCQNAMTDTRFAGSESIHNLKIKSVACIPLIGREKNIGIFYIEIDQNKNGFTDQEKQFLISIINDVCLAIENIHLREEKFKLEKNSFVNKLFSSFNAYVKETISNYHAESENLKHALKDADIEKIRYSFNTIENQISKLSEFLEDIDFYSNPPAIKPVKFDLNSYIEEFVESAKYVFEDRKLNVDINFEEKPIEICLDKDLIQKCLFNIMFFIVEFTKNNQEISIAISTETDMENNYFNIIIQDNSGGVPSNYAQQIFEPFFSCKGIRSTGLGLAIAKRIIALSGGKIECESAKNLGNTFIISLPSEIE